MNTHELFLQSPSARGPQPLEMFVRSEGPNEHHFYAQEIGRAHV